MADMGRLLSREEFASCDEEINKTRFSNSVSTLQVSRDNEPQNKGNRTNEALLRVERRC